MTRLDRAGFRLLPSVRRFIHKSLEMYSPPYVAILVTEVWAVRWLWMELRIERFH